LRGDAAGRCGGGERRGLVPSVVDRRLGLGAANRLIIEEGEDLILPDRAADAAPKLTKEAVVSSHLIARAVEALVGVQARTVSGKEETAMVLVGAALGSDLNLGATEAAVLGIIAMGNDFHAFYRIFRGRNDGRSAPDCARGADTINRNAVVFILLTSCQSLRTVFRLENALIAAGCTGALRAGKILAAAPSSLRPSAEHAWRQLDQLEDVASERRHILHLIAGDRAAYGGRLGIQRLGCPRQRCCLINLAHLKLQVECVELLWDETHMLEYLFLEPFGFCGETVRRWLQRVELVTATS